MATLPKCRLFRGQMAAARLVEPSKGDSTLACSAGSAASVASRRGSEISGGRTDSPHALGLRARTANSLAGLWIVAGFAS